jgi:hypothetical protein
MIPVTLEKEADKRKEHATQPWTVIAICWNQSAKEGVTTLGNPSSSCRVVADDKSLLSSQD